MENNVKIATKLILTVLFLCCLFDMPYGYFQMVRFLSLLGFVLLAYIDGKKKNKTLTIVWVCSAILINPLIKISLGRTIWNIVDIIWALILIITLINDLIWWRKSHHS